MSNVEYIESIEDYVKCIKNLMPREDVGKFDLKEEIVFRGLSNSDYELIPSLDRDLSGDWINTFLDKEEELVREAQQRFPQIFDSDYPTILLAKLQHYGIPTRMLDVTSNAFVGLYFACENDSVDGEVIVFSGKICSSLEPFINAIADLGLLGGNIIGEFKSIYHRIIQQPYFKSRLYIDDGDVETKRILRFVEAIQEHYIVDVGDVCNRQINQQGKFIVFPNKLSVNGDYIHTNPELLELKKTDEKVIKRIIIPSKIKKEIKKQLELFGISKQYLFADDVDVVCKSIVSKYRAIYG